jgi:pyruvate dehydrogenase E1 component beta subunit
MKVMNMVQAINHALDIKLSEDENIVIYGEDVGVEGGVFRVTEGLQKKYGEKRVFDSPLAESGIAGTAVGMAAAGLRPVIEMQFSGFVFPAFNQIVSHIARYHNRTRGKYKMPIVIRMPYGGGIRALEHHSESIEALFAHIPGLKVVIPSTPHDAKGLLISAIETDDPVVFMEPKRIYRAIKQEVSEDKFTIPIGKAKVLQSGEDITVVTYGAMVRDTQRAIILAKKAGISVELIDLRTIYPVDRDTIARSVKKTGRFLVITESPGSFGVSAELISIVNEEAFLYLEAPPTRLAGFDTIIPLPQGEHFYIHSPERIFYEIQKVVQF